MFDIGWPELMVVAVLTILVVGPQELPRVLRTVMGMMRKVRMVAGEFQNSMEDIAREADLQDIKKQMTEVGQKDLQKEFEDAVDPTGDINRSVKELEEDMEDWKAKANVAPPSSISSDAVKKEEQPADNAATKESSEAVAESETPAQQQAKSS